VLAAVKQLMNDYCEMSLAGVVMMHFVYRPHSRFLYQRCRYTGAPDM